MLSNFKFGSTYSILVRVEYNKGKYAMLGHQIGFKLDSSTYMYSIEWLYNKIKDRTDILMENYIIECIDSMQLLFIEVNTLPKLMLRNINNINLSNRGINVKDVKQKYRSSFFPLTIDPNYYGELITDDSNINIYIDKINEQKKLLLKPTINYNNYDSMFKFNNYIILNKTIQNKVIAREIYDSELGVFEACFKDIIVNKHNFIRTYNNVTLTIKLNEISDFRIKKELSLIKYVKDKSLVRRDTLVSNPFIGVFDLEAFNDLDGYAKPYAAGFCILNQDPVTFYLDNKNEDVLLNCLNSMLVSRYDRYTFYIHNLNYDGVFIINKLKSVNLDKGYEYYKINSFFRDSSILKLEISIKRVLGTKKPSKIGARRRPKDIKIVLLDSSNMLKGKLRDLCESFGLDAGKGYFPYKFVNTNNLHYVGITPSISH
ncbi:ribonuclease H-like domain-containing protein [Xylaria sp. FL0064]|nr:ribonuclease H-like domain-containing protein [Xylaria sp. FL0064]